MNSYGFHTADGWYFRRLDDNKVQMTLTHSGIQGGAAVLRDITIDDSAWASCVASVSKRGETGDTWREALRFHNDEPLPALPQCCFIEDGQECTNAALLVLTDGPAPDDYTFACQHYAKDLISDATLVYPINPIAAYPATGKQRA